MEGLADLARDCVVAAPTLEQALGLREAPRRLLYRSRHLPPVAGEGSPGAATEDEGAAPDPESEEEGFKPEDEPDPEAWRATLLGFLQPPDFPPLLGLGAIALLVFGLGAWLYRRA